MVNAFINFKLVHSSYHIIDGPETKFSHIFSNFPCNEFHEIHYIFRFSTEVLSKFSILCCNSHFTVVVLAVSQHYTTYCNETCCCKSEFLSSKKTRYGNISSSFKLTVSLHPYPASQVVKQQHLVSLRKTYFPRYSNISY